MDDNIIMIGPIRFDPQHHEAERQGITARFSPVENMILHILATHANTVCTARQLSSEVWGPSDVEGTGLIKVVIRHIRQKIEQDPNNPVYILTVPGEGYKLVIPTD